MKELIVNADDLGADEPRNQGILEAVRAGVVTSVSVLANGPALDPAVRNLTLLAPRDVSFGIHLNFSEGRSLCRGLRLLTGADGFFLGKIPARELLMRQGDPVLEDEISRELSAQIRALRNRGIPIRHLDGHQHVHVFPAVIPSAVAAAREHRIPWMRIPEETPFSCGRSGENPREEDRVFSRHGRAARPLLEGRGVRAPDHFLGLHLKGNFSLPLLRESLRSLPPGLTELMVHPGRPSDGRSAGPFSRFSTTDRERELEILLDPAFREALMEAGICLTAFPAGRS